MVPPDKLDALNKEHGLVAIEAEPGVALFFHVCLVHGSSHNIFPDGRMALFVQLNTFKNKPKNTLSNVKQFNILHAKEEVEEASRRYQFFKEKLERQVASDNPEFCPPVPDQEKKNYMALESIYVRKFDLEEEFDSLAEQSKQKPEYNYEIS